MGTRQELFLSAVDVLHSGRSLDIVGEHGSGRTHFLRRVGDHFIGIGWRTITVTGLPAFAQTPMVALAVAGVGELHDSRPTSIAASVRSLRDAITPGRTLIVVDDADDLDDFSAGVIRTVQTSAMTPVLSSRLVHRTRKSDAVSAGGFTTTYAMRLPPMAYGELEAALQSHVGFRIEPGTLSRVFAKSGGNIGLAGAVVDSAQRAGHLVVVDGVGTAAGSLWSPALRHLTEVVLAPLSREAVEALEVLALLGPAELSTAAKAVGLDRIGELEERSFLSVVEVGGSRTVSIHPPLLVEHFRHDSLPGRHAQLLARIDDLLSTGPAPGDGSGTTAHDSAAFVRLVHEHTRRRTLQAREAWQAAPSLRTATDLLTALEVDGAHDDDEATALVAAAHGLVGTERERAEWDVARLARRAIRGREPAAAVAELRERAAGMPREGGILLARAAELEVSFLTVPDADPLADLDTSGMSRRARALVLRGRGFWLLARGAHEEADGVLAELRRLEGGPDPLADAVAVLAHVVGERMSVAARIAGEGLADAQKAFDAPLIRVYAFLAALTATMDRRHDDAERLVSESSFLGLPAPFPALSYTGLKILAAESAARRGQRGLMEQLLAEIDAAGLSDGPFLGQNSGMAYARLAFVEDGPEAAASRSIESGDALWDRGALLSAAYAYLEGMLYLPDPAEWERLKPRISQIAAPGVVRQAAFVDALVSRDGEAVVDHIAVLEERGRGREALALSGIALRMLDSDETPAASAGAGVRLAELRRRLETVAVDTSEPRVTLTPREREVAELVAAGLTNAVIAEALVLSVRTVESHINRLLRKAGLHRRADVKAFLLAQDAVA
ncbi:helix-turn-helix transcriptional regulator [Microbacterium sp. RU33B]|uniref:helix-turn-helix domain-containing protein n=1 Tax=Microbacterium sp. RU33B TaxID=1907390 RepID=UPI000964B9D0|nr:helix-turn-helix transcriptional regulator [Microbacterium sp. RU33B]SIT78643.1 regulatory protein, luxR family [Microbacterium sp. RU33B]